MKSILANLFLLLSCCSILGQQTGNTPGNLSVSITGNSTYSIPLLTSPGKSPQPNLSLVINSQNINGIAGNADIAGVSQQITRSSKTIGTFGENASIGLDANDVFSLNNDPLKLTNSIKYGSEGASYAPQHNPNIEVQSFGNILNTGTPLYFIVKTKDNLTFEFGRTTDSRIEPAGSNIPIHYMLNKVADPSGNYYTIKYLEAEGVAYPLEISYTGNVNAKLLPYNTIKFSYQNQSGPDQYVAGTRIRKTKLLSGIKSYHGQSLFREYKLSYKNFGNANKSLLTEITECGLNGACLNPTKFQYSTDFSIKEKASQNFIRDLRDLKTIIQIQAIDLNMDGVSDLLATWKKDGTNIYYRTILITNNDFETLSSSVVSSLYSRVLQFGKPQNNSSRVFVKKQINEKITEQEAREETEYVQADFNGDGKTDFVIVTENYLRVMLNETVSGNITLRNKFTINLENDLKKSRAVVGDFDGNGLSDIIIHRGDKGAGYYFKKSTSVELTYEKKCCQFPTNLNAYREGDFYDFIPSDFDGDNDLDLLVKTRKKVAILKSNQQKFSALVDISSRLAKDGDIQSLQATDINNDGLPDLVKSFHYSCGPINDNIKFVIHWNTGKLIFSSNTKELIKGNFTRNSPRQIFFTDFNLDGNVDMGVIGQFGNERCKSGIYASFFNSMLLINGDGKGNFIKERSSYVFNAEQGRFEKGELIILPGRFFSTPSVNVLAIHKKQPELHQLVELYTEPKYQLTKVFDGFGNTSEITYQPLLKNEIYKQAGYSLRENQVVIQSPLYVASHVTRSNSSGGVEGLSYKYEDAVVDLFRGFLGFRKVITENHLNKIRIEDTYSLYHRYGEPKLEESKTYLDKTLIEYQKNTNLVYDYKLLGIYDTRLIYTLERKYDPKFGKLISEIKNDFAFDDFGNLVSAITSYQDEKKDELSNIYDNDPKRKKSGRLIKSIRTISAPRKERVVKTAAFKYDSLGLLVEEIVEPTNALLRKTTQYQRDVFGNIIEKKVIGKVGDNSSQVRTTQCTFDKFGLFKVTEKNPLGHVSEFIIDRLSGKILQSIGPNGDTTKYRYDNFYRLSEKIFPDNTWESFQYLKSDVSIQGNRAVYKVVKKNTLGINKTIHFDGLDKEIRSESTAPMGRIVILDKTYNNTGQLIKESLPYFKNSPILWINKTYNALNQLIRENYPDGTARTFSYNDLTTSTTNERGFSSSTVSDIHGNPVQHINPNGVAVNKSYTIQNQLESISFKGEKRVEYKYNILNQVIEKSDISSGIEFFGYNAFEELIDHHTALGATQHIKDKAGRTTEKISGKDTQHLLDTIYYKYDVGFKGKLSEVTKKSSDYRKKISYDSKGFPIEVTETIRGVSLTTLHFYNSFRQLHQIIYPSTKDTITYSYDQGAITKVKHNSKLIWELKDYDSAGHHTYVVSGNGTMTFRQYDQVNGTLLHTKTLDNRGKEIQNWDFFYNELGSLVAQRDNLAAKQENYEYDPSEQLTKTKVTGGEEVSIDYLEDGSIASRSDVGEYLWESGQLVGVNFFKDIECNTSLNADIYYTSFNKVRRIDKDGVNLYIDYGPDNQRIFHSVYQNGKLIKTRYYFGTREIDITANGTQEVRTHLSNGQEAFGILALKNNVSSISYLHKNHLGSIVAITDGSSKIVERLNYNAWGERRDTNWVTMANPKINAPELGGRGFTLHEHYDIVGLVDMNGRVYDPKLGVFLSADIVYQSTDDAHLLNRYAYVGNNPLSKIDPSGYFWERIGGWFKDNWKGLVTTAVSVAVGIIAAPLGPLAPALAGAAGGLTGSLLNGQSLSATLKNTYKGFVIGGVSGAASTVVGDLAEGQGLLGHLTTKVVGHSLVQGSVSVAYGGSFWSGAAAGAFTAGVSPFTKSLFSNSRTGRLIMAMTVGGTASELAGGEFANGALAAAFVQLYNDEKHKGDALKEKLEQINGVSEKASWTLEIAEEYKLFKSLFIKAKFFGQLSNMVSMAEIAYDYWAANYYDMVKTAFSFTIGYSVGSILVAVEAPVLISVGVGAGISVGGYYYWQYLESLAQGWEKGSLILDN